MASQPWLSASEAHCNLHSGLDCIPPAAVLVLVDLASSEALIQERARIPAWTWRIIGTARVHQPPHHEDDNEQWQSKHEQRSKPHATPSMEKSVSIHDVTFTEVSFH